MPANDDVLRERIRDDLRGLFKGEILVDDINRGLYSTDASIFQVEPLAVATPRDEADIQTVVKYAVENRIPVIPRGAGSGLAGESLGRGLVVDVSRHLRSVIDIQAERVRVQPGVVYAELNRRLAPHGRRFAPNPNSGTQCTIGGMLATNASGPNVLVHGYTCEHVQALRLVLDTGELGVAGIHRREPSTEVPAGHLEDIVSAVLQLLESRRAWLQSSWPRTKFDRCGYGIHDVVSGSGLDLPRLLVGSEGTLAIFSEATLRTVPLAAGHSRGLFCYASLEAAIDASRRAVAAGSVSCELIDHRLFQLARADHAVAASILPAVAQVGLFVEFESDRPRRARFLASELASDLRSANPAALFALVAWEGEEAAFIDQLHQTAVRNLYGLRGRTHPVPAFEDIAVPLDEMEAFLHRLHDILQQHDVIACFLIHPGTGQVQARPLLDMDIAQSRLKIAEVAEQVHALALEHGGTVSTRHGTGLARSPWVSRQYGQLYSLFRELKNIFDPHGIFNPGKIVGSEQFDSLWPLRAKGRADTDQPMPTVHSENGIDGEKFGEQEGVASGLCWQPGQLQAEMANCNGCGHCRAETPPLRMCPIFRATHAEAATPRAKANLMRAILSSEDHHRLTSDEVRSVADLCVNCKMCALECPTHVDIPKMMLEAKAANVAEHGLDRSDWALAQTESFAAFGSAFAFLVNATLDSRTVRWLLEKFFGISRKRRLPRFAGRSFLKMAARKGWTRKPHSGSPRVAYFVDVFANYNDPQIAEATVAVLLHQGIEVYVPPNQAGCGIAPLSQGDFEGARDAARRNLRALAEVAREGFPIICSEPTAALMLRQEYLDLMNDGDARLVAEKTVELTAFLWDLYCQGRLKTDFQRLHARIGHHIPCHVKALGGRPAGPSLLGLIPGLDVKVIDVSCSGMAGTFGLKADNYDVSMRAGRPMLQELARPDIDLGSAECSSCRMQMEHGARRRSVHPVELMALAYGLMPEVSRDLKRYCRTPSPIAPFPFKIAQSGQMMRASGLRLK
jgi:FAD/FMN-containing dehydrogenase/Fe-S oxidoreductase